MIFNKSKKGSAEVKERIGFIYKSINFDNLKPYMLFAERDLKQIIGKDVFDVAEQHYNGDHYCQETADEDHPEYPVLDEFVSRIQMVVAIQAYRRFVPSNDIAHSDKGRQIFDRVLSVASGEHSKSESLGYGEAEFAPWQIGAVM